MSSHSPDPNRDLEKNHPNALLSRWGGIKGYLNQDVSEKHCDLVLIICSFISGLCDSGAFEAWSCFVSMQTGNTIFLGLGAAGLPASKPLGWLRSIVSISAFLVGCVSFSRLRNYRPRSRGMLLCSFTLQAICLTISAVLVETKVVPDSADGPNPMRSLAPIVFLALQGGGQVWNSDVLGFKEIPTTVLTSVYLGIALDVKFFLGFKENASRNRRLGTISALLLGAICGGWLCRSKAGIPGIFFVAAGLKYVIAITWLRWPSRIVQE